MLRSLLPPIHRFGRAQVRGTLLAALAVALSIGLCGWWSGGPLERIDRGFLDALVAAEADGPAPDDVVVIDIDEASLAAVGQWPWPRYRIATLLEQIRAAGPSAIALDIVFPEPDRTSPLNLQQQFQRDFGLDLTIAGVPPGLLDNDGYLGEVTRSADVVTGEVFHFDRRLTPAVPPRPGVAFTGRIDRLAPNVATGVLQNTEAIARQAPASGFFNLRADDDGVVRRLPLVIRYDGVLHPNLALAAAMRAAGSESAAIESDMDSLWLQVGKRRLPIDTRGEALLRFDAPPERYPTIAAVDLLTGRSDPALLRGRMVFVGSTAAALNDVQHTATATRFPGLKIQAATASNLLRGRVAWAPAWAPSAGLLASLAIAVLIARLFVTGRGPGPLCLAPLACAGAAAAGCALLYRGGAMFVSPAVPMVAAGLLGLAALAARFAVEQHRARVWRAELENARQVTLESMASVAETRDPETGAHIKRTQHYVRAIAEQLRREGRHLETLSDQYIELLFLSAPLHDIGKVGVPDHILLKPARLTPAEMETMKLHAEYGRKIIWSTSQRIQGENFLIIAGDIAATHHERWDGAGYPKRLAGEAIPLAGRIMAVADVYDALISRRCYKEPYTHARATGIILDQRGQAFDPQVVDAFFAIERQIVEIALRFQDEDGDEADTLGLHDLMGVDARLPAPGAAVTALAA